MRAADLLLSCHALRTPPQAKEGRKHHWLRYAVGPCYAIYEITMHIGNGAQCLLAATSPRFLPSRSFRRRLRNPFATERTSLASVSATPYAHLPSRAMMPAPSSMLQTMKASCLSSCVRSELNRKSRAISSTRPV
jgi:hypothetical protein